MAEPNPYESPKTGEPLKPAQVVKRVVGVGLILLLTPPAMVIAVLTCCNVIAPAVRAGPLVSFVALPTTLLTGLMVLAAVLEWRKDAADRAPRRIVYLLATPIAVLVGTAGGYGLALLSLSLFFHTPDSELYGIWLAVALFWLVPSIVLLAMLWAAWRAE